MNRRTVDEGGRTLEGTTFVITGSVEHFANRSELKRLIESKGGKVTGSVTSKTSYLINNDAASTSSQEQEGKGAGRAHPDGGGVPADAGIGDDARTLDPGTVYRKDVTCQRNENNRNENEIEKEEDRDVHVEDKKDDGSEKFCFICHRPESVTGKLIDLPNNISVCPDCMQKSLTP